MNPIIIITFLFAGLAVASILVFQKYFLVIDESWKASTLSKLQQIENGQFEPNSKIIQVDKLIEFSLQKRLKNTESFGKNLKSSGNKLFTKSELNKIWELHKARNNLVHNINVDLHSSNSRVDILGAINAIKGLLLK